ncbi:MAG: (2Fe-2S)-binding protein [Deltaproteobacteria bacterium]|nr:(2Fe-2S)-binding protein [Deltaproteobacteria bacterium]
MTQTIECIINGRKVQFSITGSETLLECLREQAGLTGAKRGCDEGDCGACTVLMDGRPVNACLVLAAEAAGSDITTIEGIGQEGKKHPLQQAFIEQDAVQCGFCTPGMILTAAALLKENEKPTENEIRQYLQGNLCRCTGYSRIVRAVQAASRVR